MKIEQPEKLFRPITIVLETPEESEALEQALHYVKKTRSGITPELYDLLQFLREANQEGE